MFFPYCSSLAKVGLRSNELVISDAVETNSREGGSLKGRHQFLNDGGSLWFMWRKIIITKLGVYLI